MAADPCGLATGQCLFGPSRDPEEPVEPGLGRDDRNLFFEEQQKTRLAPRTC
jgi:hypothetical protein